MQPDPNNTYHALWRMARRLMAGERVGHTLQTTALVHEAYLKLVAGREEDENREGDRSRTLRTAATIMRHILVDHARARKALRRGGDRKRTTLDGAVAWYEENSGDFLSLHESLLRLQERDEQLASVVELRYFAGLTEIETADILGISPRTVQRAWRSAREWLYQDLNPAEQS